MSFDFEGRTALVTGASSGIGAALARALAGRGARVALLARREERLREVAGEIENGGGAALVVTADLTRDDAVPEAVERVRGEWGRIDVLVNNAGAGLVSPLEETPPDEALALFDLNVVGMLRTLREVVPEMVERGSGAIVQMSSSAGLKALPVSGVYSATKFAVRGLTQALRLELGGTGVQVHCVFPVGTRTEFMDAARDHVGTEESGRFYQGALVPLQTPDEVAEAVLRGVEKGRAAIYPYRPVRLLLLLDAVSPGLVERLAGLRDFRERVLAGREPG